MKKKSIRRSGDGICITGDREGVKEEKGLGRKRFLNSMKPNRKREKLQGRKRSDAKTRWGGKKKGDPET